MCLFVNIFIFIVFVFFFNDTATTEIYTLSLHDALPICDRPHAESRGGTFALPCAPCGGVRLLCRRHSPPSRELGSPRTDARAHDRRRVPIGAPARAAHVVHRRVPLCVGCAGGRSRCQPLPTSAGGTRVDPAARGEHLPPPQPSDLAHDLPAGGASILPRGLR